MDTPTRSTSTKKRSGYMMAVVLGTALSAAGVPPALALSPQVPEETLRDLTRYCTTCWRNAHLDPACWPDCTQEVFCRLLERVEPEAWDRLLRDENEDRREFLRAIDAVKKRTQRGRGRYITLAEPVADRRDAADRRLAEERGAVEHAAAVLLSPRQQQILRKSLEGWSVNDIATALAVPPERVSDEKYKAVQKLRSHFTQSIS